MKWSPEAEQAISKVPFFVRKRVKRRVEEEAIAVEARVVTLDHVRSCQRRFMERMEEEVRGHQVETCFGPLGCPNRAVAFEGMAGRVEEILASRDLKSFLKERVGGPLKLHHEFRVSISDCPNACSRPQIADVGLIGARMPTVSDVPCEGCGSCFRVCREEAVTLGESGPSVDQGRCLGCGQCIQVCPTGTLQEGEAGYRILLGGKLGRHPRLATELHRLYAQGRALELIDRVIGSYIRSSVNGERLGEIVERMGWEKFLKGIGD